MRLAVPGPVWERDRLVLRSDIARALSSRLTIDHLSAVYAGRAAGLAPKGVLRTSPLDAQRGIRHLDPEQWIPSSPGSTRPCMVLSDPPGYRTSAEVNPSERDE